MNIAVRCGSCGDVIGVYEPIVVVVEGGPRTTSGAAEPELTREAAECYHHNCYLATFEYSAGGSGTTLTQ
jgi:hypothetical protein